MQFSGTMLEAHTVEGALVVRFLVSAIINQREAEAVFSEVRQAVEEADGSRLVLNFQGVKHVASLMLGKLLSLRKFMAERRGRLVLCGLAPSLHELLKVSGFLKLLPVAADEEEAVKG